MAEYVKLPYRGMHADHGILYYRSSSTGILKRPWDKSDAQMHAFAKACAKRKGLHKLPRRSDQDVLINLFVLVDYSETCNWKYTFLVMLCFACYGNLAKTPKQTLDVDNPEAKEDKPAAKAKAKSRAKRKAKNKGKAKAVCKDEEKGEESGKSPVGLKQQCKLWVFFIWCSVMILCLSFL